MNEDLPSFVVMISVPAKVTADQGLLARLWGAGFLPSRHQGVRLRGAGEPVLYLQNPPGVSREHRRDVLDGLADLNRQQFEWAGDPEIEGRIAQYEMAFRMQTSVPDLVDLRDEPESTFRLYGDEAKQPGCGLSSCITATGTTTSMCATALR